MLRARKSKRKSTSPYAASSLATSRLGRNRTSGAPSTLPPQSTVAEHPPALPQGDPSALAQGNVLPPIHQNNNPPAVPVPSTLTSDFVLFLCLHGCILSYCNVTGPDPCKQCMSEKCTNYQQNTTKCPTPNPSTCVCNCPSTVVDCSECQTPTTESTTKTKTTSEPTTTAPAITTATHTTTMTTTPQITKTTTAITTPTTSSAYPEPAQQKGCLCSDNQGAVIGAAVGGTIFGSILTAIIFVYIHRRSKNPFNSKDGQTSNQTSRTVRNAAYGYSTDIDQVNSVTVPVNSAYSEINDGMRKSAVISPIMRQADSLKSDEVYNHLHESDKDDRSDNYDHAGPAPSLSIMEDGYGVLSMESEGNDNYNTVDRDHTTDRGKSMTDENKQSNDYFILETQNN